SIFKGKKIVIIGDIALDRTFLCHLSPPGLHATHGGETIFDIVSDDFGTVGSANCTSFFCNSMEANSVLLTVIGNDQEGARVKEVLKLEGINAEYLELDGIQTVTKFRFFEFSDDTGVYKMRFRTDKEPDYNLSYIKAREKISEPH